MSATYTLKGYKSVRSTDGDAFEATILQDGKPYLLVTNSGTGGPNSYYPAKGNQLLPDAAYREFKAAAVEWAAESDKHYSEVEDLFTEHLVHELDLQKQKAKMAKKGYPVTVVVRKDEWTDEILGLRSEAQIDQVRIQYAAYEIRVL